jgi:hypothetical protein
MHSPQRRFAHAPATQPASRPPTESVSAFRQNIMALMGINQHRANSANSSKVTKGRAIRAVSASGNHGGPWRVRDASGLGSRHGLMPAFRMDHSENNGCQRVRSQSCLGCKSSKRVQTGWQFLGSQAPGFPTAIPAC